MNKLLLVILSVVLVSGLIFSGCGAEEPETTIPKVVPTPEQPLELKLSSWVPPVSLPAKDMIDPWIATIYERTGGRVKITHYAAQSLGAQADHYNMVINRQADIVQSGGTTGILRMIEVSNLPFLYTTAEMAGVVHWQLSEKHLWDAELKNVKVLWLMPVAPDNLCTNIKQVKTLEDMKGMKIATGSDMGLRTLKALGATPTFVPPPEIYTALERGLVDAISTNWEKAIVFKEHEVTKYRTGSINMWVNVMPIYMNLDAWNELPADIQQIFEETGGLAYSQRNGALFDTVDQEFRGIIEGYDKEVGNPPFYDISADERARWIAATAPIHDEWVNELEADGLPARALLDDANALAEAFGK